MRRLRSMYPAQTGPVTTAYPYGSFRNRQFIGDLAGTPLEEKWANDINGFMAALLVRAGVTPTGLPETANNSQCATAVQTIARDAVTRGSFSWPASSHSLIGASNAVYHWCPAWGAGNGTNFLVDPGMTLVQTTRTDSAYWHAPLIQPPGRWRIRALAGRVEHMESSPSVSPFVVTLRRRDKTSGGGLVDIASLQWGSGFSAGYRIVNVSDTHWVTGGQVYDYSIRVQGEEHSSDYSIMGSRASIFNLAVVLEFDPF